jgi:hypothetical protein
MARLAPRSYIRTVRLLFLSLSTVVCIEALQFGKIDNRHIFHNRLVVHIIYVRCVHRYKTSQRQSARGHFSE